MRPWILPVLLAVLPAAAAGEGPEIRRGDAKAYRLVNDTKHLPRLDRGDAERTIVAPPWRALPRPADDPLLDEPERRRQIIDATCDAELVVIARIESAMPFQHPNSRWVVTAYDLAVSRVVRSRSPKTKPPERLRYVHPSGELTVAGRAVRTTIDRFPLLAGDEEGLFFLVPIGRGAYRTSLLLPPMALRSGVLDPFGSVPPNTEREPAAGFGVRDATRAAWDAVCRPPPIERDLRSPTGDGRLPPFSGPPPPY